MGTNVPPFTYTGIRLIIAAIALTPVVRLFSRGNVTGADYPAPDGSTDPKAGRKLLLRGGIQCGIFMFLGTFLQQAGLSYIGAGKSGFITATYTVLVPVAAVFLGKKIRPIVWVGAAVCLAGLYLLCMMGEEMTIGRGDILTLLCAFAFMGQILSIDHFSALVSGVRLSRLQALTAGILSLIGMVLFEKPDLHEILIAWGPILYGGVLSGGVAYTLQILGQKHSEPTEATIIMSLESVFSVLAGALVLHEVMEPAQYLGCILIFSAILMTQIQPRRKVPRAGGKV